MPAFQHNYLPLRAERREQAIGVTQEGAIVQLLSRMPAAGGVERRRGQVVHRPAVDSGTPADSSVITCLVLGGLSPFQV